MSIEYKSWLEIIRIGQTKHQLNTILNKYFQTKKSSAHWIPQPERLNRRKVCLIADAAITLEKKKIKKQVKSLIIRKDLVVV